MAGFDGSHFVGPAAAGFRSLRSLACALLCLLLVPLVAAAEVEPVQRSLARVNEEREAQGLEPLSVELELVAAAEAHAEDMLERDFYGHVSPDGETVRDRYLAAGGHEGRLVLENIALCESCPTPPGIERVEAFHDGWMESPEHREAILDPGAEAIGFAMRWDEGRVFGVQTFAGPGRPRGLPPSEPEEELASEALREHALAAINAVREAEGLPPLEPSEDLDWLAEDVTQDGDLAEPEAALAEAVPGELDPALGAVTVVSGTCGGCGTVPTAADVESFLEDWLEEPALRERLLDPDAKRLGYALSADGEGRKAAAAIIGLER